MFQGLDVSNAWKTSCIGKGRARFHIKWTAFKGFDCIPARTAPTDSAEEAFLLSRSSNHFAARSPALMPVWWPTNYRPS